MEDEDFDPSAVFKKSKERQLDPFDTAFVPKGPEHSRSAAVTTTTDGEKKEESPDISDDDFDPRA